MESKTIAVYRGVPSPPTHMETLGTSSRVSGIQAFLFGLFLSLFAWIANQGWTVISLLLFGAFDWSNSNAWKHLLFCTVGSIATSFAWCSVFRYWFPEVEDEDDANSECNPRSYKRDVSDALHDLGELGFVAGYLFAQYVGVEVINATTRITIAHSDGFDTMMTVLLLVWVFFSKVQDYTKAIKRARAYELSNAYVEAHYVQMV
jgi:hypothetical protein